MSLFLIGLPLLIPAEKVYAIGQEMKWFNHYIHSLSFEGTSPERSPV